MRDGWLAAMFLAAAACGGSSHATGDAPVAPDSSPIADAPIDAPACTLTMCGSDCVDLMTSVEHCGSCDHACGCGETTCTAGVCDSAPLATAQGCPVALALHDDTLYWGNDADMNVSTVALTPGATATVLFSGRTAVRGFAFDATRVYFSRTVFNIMESGLQSGASSGNYTTRRNRAPTASSPMGRPPTGRR